MTGSTTPPANPPAGSLLGASRRVRFRHFGVSIFSTILFPLLPIFIEWVLMDEISPVSLTVTAAIYSVTVGVASREVLLLFLTIVACIVFCSSYGMLLKDTELFIKQHSTVQVASQEHKEGAETQSLQKGEPAPQTAQISVFHPVSPISSLATGLAILAIALLHGCERYFRHMSEGEPFYSKWQ